MAFSDKTDALTMRSLELLAIGLILAAARASCESYNKACFLNYMLSKDLLDKTYQIYSNGEKVDAKCEAAINATVTKLRSATNDVCAADFLKKKFVSETLIKQYLIPQFREPGQQVDFDDRFTVFTNKAMNLTNVICANKDVFQPDLRSMMRNGRLQKESKTKEIECLQKYLTNKNKPLDTECSKSVNSIKAEFYKSTENDIRRCFSPPNDNLVNLKCSEEKAKKNQMFEKIFFFVVLAATKNMNDKQIDVMLSSASGVITSSTRTLFECLI